MRPAPDHVALADVYIGPLNGLRRRLLGLWTFHSSDPLTVSLHLHQWRPARPRWVVWELHRPMLAAAAAAVAGRAVGGGEVWMWPLLDDPEQLVIRLSSPEGSAFVTFRVAQVREFLTTVDLLMDPHGEAEQDAVDQALETALEQILGGGA